MHSPLFRTKRVVVQLVPEKMPTPSSPSSKHKASSQFTPRSYQASGRKYFHAALARTLLEFGEKEGDSSFNNGERSSA